MIAGHSHAQNVAPPPTNPSSYFACWPPRKDSDRGRQLPCFLEERAESGTGVLAIDTRRSDRRTGVAPLLEILPIDHIHTMGIDPSDEYALKADPVVWAEYRSIMKDLAFKRDLEPIMKWEFYESVMSDDHVLTIQTADQATWANLLLVVGVRTS